MSAGVGYLTGEEVLAAVAHEKAALRESIAANVEALGCDPQWCGMDHCEHDANCPVAIATAIREGRA